MTSLKGQLLVASTQLRDPNFFRAVVLMVQHDKHGAMGLVLNRPTETTIKAAWEQVSEQPCEREDALYVGGPCEGVLMALHTRSDASDIEVLPGVHFTAAAGNISSLVQITDDPARFFVGYAGWSPGQLEGEMKQGAWLTAPATPQRVFQADEDVWVKVVKEISWASVSASLNPKLIPPDPSVN